MCRGGLEEFRMLRGEGCRVWGVWRWVGEILGSEAGNGTERL